MDKVHKVGAKLLKLTNRARGDINGDAIVNNNDLILRAQAFDATPSSPCWNPEKEKADLNKDNTLDVRDLEVLDQKYGKTA